MSTVAESGLAAIDAALSSWRYPVSNERELQDLVVRALTARLISTRSEARIAAGVIDVLVPYAEGVELALELKVRGAAAAVERQAQRYALDPGIAGVAVVTTSARLAHQLLAGAAGTATLGGKPFRVIRLGGW